MISEKVKDLVFIDDDEITNYLMANLLKKAGYRGRATFFSTAREALAWLAGQETTAAPQYIFLDIKMPDMNGYDFLEEYTRCGYHETFSTRICVLSSSVNEADQYRSEQYAPVQCYLNKPLTIKQINELAEQHP
jgi:CheY-like chemotaxis protein